MPRVPANPRILLVEDDRPAAQALAKLLRADGFDVDMAFDGAEAVGKLARGAPPDALVTDVRMPRADGIAVARYARGRSPEIPVIFVTGYPELA
jgi:CheY-like chemotaxis protein